MHRSGAFRWDRYDEPVNEWSLDGRGRGALIDPVAAAGVVYIWLTCTLAVERCRKEVKTDRGSALQKRHWPAFLEGTEEGHAATCKGAGTE
jgi:hypothetical protein